MEKTKLRLFELVCINFFKTRFTGDVLDETEAELVDDVYDDLEFDEELDITGLEVPEENGLFEDSIATLTCFSDSLLIN